jgi:hypothetical protein
VPPVSTDCEKISAAADHAASDARTLEADLLAAQRLNGVQATRIKLLEAELAALDPGWIWNDDFQSAPSLARYILAAANPDEDFILDSQGNLRVRFLAGKKDADGKAILRSELMIREPGTNNAFREKEGDKYLHEIGFTIPADYDPAVSSKPNEKRNFLQWHQVSGKAPAVALELIKPDGEPWNGIQNILRLVVLGKVAWWINAKPGERYDFAMQTLRSTALGFIKTTIAQEGFLSHVGPNLYDEEPRSVAQHIGLYLPGAADDPPGGKTEMLFHYWRVRAA